MRSLHTNCGAFHRHDSEDGLTVDYVCPTFSVRISWGESKRKPGLQFFEDIECLLDQEAATICLPNGQLAMDKAREIVARMENNAKEEKQ